MDSEQLGKLLKDTPVMISRHRVNTEKGGIGYSDTPTLGGFEPSLPMNYDAMDAADMEAAWLGNVMKHCVNMGAIPALKFEPFHEQPHHNLDHSQSSWWGRTFWWIGGRCKGLSGGRMEDVEYGFFGKVSDGWGGDIGKIVEHLRAWAPSVLRVEGVMPFIEDGVRIRAYSDRCFPSEVDEWLTVDEAAKIAGVTEKTMRNWLAAKAVRHIGEGVSAQIDRNSLKFRIDSTHSNVGGKMEKARQSRW